MTKSHYVAIRVDEDGYAEAASAAYEQAEANAGGLYPDYPEPFKGVGCGWGKAGEFVVNQAFELATEMRLDIEACTQSEVQLNLFCGDAKAYREFRERLAQRAAPIQQWVRIDPA